MVKTASVAELGHGAASRVVREAQQEPVLVSKENKPAAWVVSARAVADMAAARGDDGSVYQRVLELLAIDLYSREVVTLGTAAKLAGMPLGDFIDLCGALRVPVLWGPDDGINHEVDVFAALLEDADAATDR